MRSPLVKVLPCLSVVAGILICWSGSPASLRGDDAFAPPPQNSAPTPFYGNGGRASQPGLIAPQFDQNFSNGGTPEFDTSFQPQQGTFCGESGCPSCPSNQPCYREWQPQNENSCPCSNNQCDGSGLKLFDHFDVFAGLDGSKQPQDFGVNALFGGRIAVNAGWLLDRESGLGLQAATSLNVSDNAVQVFEALGGSTHRVQNYSTLSLYQRSPLGFNWGFGFDLLRENYYDQFLLGQWRGKGGYLFTKTDEFGAWFTIPQIHDEGSFAGLVPVSLKPIQQTALFWTHQWESQGYTTVWGGYSRRHGEVNLALGDLDPVTYRPTFGAEVHVPLNDHVALYGQANFLSPFDTGTVDSFLGLTFYPGGGARRAPGNIATPVLPVANNTMFSTDLRR